MKTLSDIWFELPMKSDKGNVHSYLPVYEEILAPYRFKAKNILEIGLFNGASLLMWEQYFARKVFGIDCNVKPHGGMADLTPLIESGKHNIWIMDAEDPAQLEKWFRGIKFDVVIEDAAHHVEQQMKIRHNMKPYLSEGSIYIMEDVQSIDTTKYLFWPEGEVIDRRKVKGRYDDILVIYRQ